MGKSCTLYQEAENVPPVNPLPLYKCSECSYATTTTQALKEPKRNKHEKEKSKIMDAVFLHSYISCECKFIEKSVDLSSKYVLEQHVPNSYRCDKCNLCLRSDDELNNHMKRCPEEN